MKNLLIIVAFTFVLMSCTKDEALPTGIDPLIGKWTSHNFSFSILNTTGIAAPFCVIKKADSLIVVLKPLVDLHYKILSVDYEQLKVSSDGVITAYKRQTY